MAAANRPNYGKLADKEYKQQSQQLTEEANRLCVLAKQGDLDAMRISVNRQNCDARVGANNSRRYATMTILMIAVKHSRSNAPATIRIVELLLEQGASVNKRDRFGRSALHFAASYANAAVVQELIKYGADINAQNKKGNTPLIVATCNLSGISPASVAAVVKLLLDLGADPHICNYFGDTALSWANKSNLTEAARLLRSAVDNDDEFEYQDDFEDEDEYVPVYEDDFEDFDTDEHEDEDENEHVYEDDFEDFNTDEHEDEDENEDEDKDEFLENNAYEVTKYQGICVIINVNKYNGNRGFKDRDGSQKDVERVEKVFKNLGFDIHLKEDLTAAGIQEFLSDVSRDFNRNYGSFVCFLMAHGTNGVIYGSDGRDQQLRYLAMLFNPTKCPSLAGKPKIFFVQACRSLSADRLTSADKLRQADTSSVDGNFPFEELPPAEPTTSTSASSSAPLSYPAEADFLFCYATTEDAVAWRDAEKGSPFIQTVCDVISQTSRKLHLYDMLVVANNKLIHKLRAKEAASILEINSKLTRSMWLKPHR